MGLYTFGNGCENYGNINLSDKKYISLGSIMHFEKLFTSKYCDYGTWYNFIPDKIIWIWEASSTVGISQHVFQMYSKKSYHLLYFIRICHRLVVWDIYRVETTNSGFQLLDAYSPFKSFLINFKATQQSRYRINNSPVPGLNFIKPVSTKTC